MSLLNKAEIIKDMVQDAIDSGATSIEEVHKNIAQLPIDQLENLGLLDAEESHEKKALINRSIGQVYDSIRKVNAKVGEFASDIFEGIEEAQADMKDEDRR